MGWLMARETSTFSSKEVKDNFRRRFADRQEAMDAALAWLEERGHVRKLPERPSVGGRRRSYPTYEVNPSLKESQRETRETHKSV